jgi:hypothetical protein
MNTEYQVRPVTRYIVTCYTQDCPSDSGGCGASSTTVGEFSNSHQADSVADAMVAKDSAAGIKSNRTRHGLTLGEVISGQRVV